MEPDPFSTLRSNLERFLSCNASLSPSVDRRLSEGRDRICLIHQHLPKTHIARQLVPTRCLIKHEESSSSILIFLYCLVVATH